MCSTHEAKSFRVTTHQTLERPRPGLPNGLSWLMPSWRRQAQEMEDGTFAESVLRTVKILSDLVCWPRWQLHYGRDRGCVGDCQFGEHCHPWVDSHSSYIRINEMLVSLELPDLLVMSECLGSNDVLWTECVICSRWERDGQCLVAHIWRLNQRVNVNVGRGSRHRTLRCDVWSVGNIQGLAHTGERREMRQRTPRQWALCGGEEWRTRRHQVLDWHWPPAGEGEDGKERKQRSKLW